jgi:HD-GYP domain-containing protein (c-di-GMP phosphodiesterase class II)
MTKLTERTRSHDVDLFLHSGTVGHLSFTFAACLGYSLSDRRLLGQAALVHDVGKLHIPTSVLRKPGMLNEQEWAVMQTHPTAGVTILENDGIYDSTLRDVVLNHHERLDGTGYPAGLRGAQVSEAFRIITLCDVFAAMTETRVYARPYTWKGALDLMAEKRTQLDLRLLKHFDAMIRAQHDNPGRVRSNRSSVFAECEVRTEAY